MATLVARCCQKTNQLQSVQWYGKQRTHKNIYKSKKRKKCCHGNTCCQVCQKTNPLQSVQGYGKQRTHKMLKVQETEKSAAMATLVASYR